MAGYTRQSTFADGDTITAALFNNEYNQVLNAFSNTGGHKHDGTAAEGPVIGLIGDAGVVTPLNKVLIDSTNDHIEFWIDVSSSSVQQLYIADGAIVPVTDSDVDLGTSSLYFKNAYIDSITTTGNVAVGGNLTVTGTTTFNGGTITMGDAATDNVVFGADVDSNIIPDDDDSYDLGSSSQEWRNLYIDGTAHIDTLDVDVNATIAGTLGVTGVLTGTSLDISGDIDVDGTTNLDVVDIDGAVDMATTLAVAGNVDFNGDLDVDGTTNLDVVDIDGAVDMATTLAVAGNVDFNGDLDVDGTTNLDVVDIDGAVDMATTLTVAGEITAASLDISGNVDIDGVLETDGLSINGTTVTSTAAELNILDGVTATATEINLIDGVTSTTAELNILDGVTASATDINLIDGITNGTVIASKAIVTDANIDITGGRNITISGELDAGSLDVSGNVDVDGTLETDALSINGTTVTSTAAELNILDGVTATATELNALDGITSTVAELNILDGVTSTAAEINLLDGKAFLDEDNMASNSATGIASQQSIKAYVDTTVAATNEVVEDTTPQLGGDLDLNSSDITGTGNINITGTIQSSGNITGTLATAAQPNITSLGTLTGLTGGTGDLNWDSGTLFVDSSANKVGIGLTNPADYYADQLVVSAPGEGGITIASTATSNNNYLMFADGTSGDTAYRGQIIYAHGSDTFTLSSAGTMAFHSNNTERMRIDGSSGNVGIGTTSTDRKLTVLGSSTSQGTIYAYTNEVHTGTDTNAHVSIRSDNASASGDVLHVRGDGTGNLLTIDKSGTEVLVVDSSGNVGIGTVPSNWSANTFDVLQIGDSTGIGNISSRRDGVNEVNLGLNWYYSGGATNSYVATSTATNYQQKDGSHIWSNAAQGSANAALTFSESMRIDSSGRVGIGVTSPARALEVNTDGTAQFRLTRTDSTINGNNSIGTIEFVGTDDTSGTIGATIVAHAETTWGGGSYPTDLRFSTMTGSTLSERMRIDSSGNLLVGKTSLGIGITGSEIRAGGQLLVTADADNPADFNRKTSDGLIAVFRKDSTIVGSIGTVAGDMFLGTASTGVRFLDANNEIIPITVSSGGGSTDGTISLGGSAYRFKDLYLSGQSLVQGGATTAPSFAFTNDPDTGMSRPTSDAINFCTAGAERMRIESSGDIRFGCTAAQLDSSEVYSFNNGQRGNTIAINTVGSAAFYSIDMTNQSGGSCNQVRFRAGASATVVGTISSSGNNSTQYNTSSDYRLKENVAPIQNGLTRLQQLNPVQFDWINSGETSEGFIAHEVQEIFSDAVTGEKDAEEMQGMDYGRITPLLVKAIQEQQTQIDALQSEINLLKGE